MDHLDEISVEDLQRALDKVDGKKPIQRLMAMIACKNGVSQTELAEWYDVQCRTIYNWLKRLLFEPLEHAVCDDHRSGKPRKLSNEQQAQLGEILHEPPAQAGFDVPVLVLEYLDDHLHRSNEEIGAGRAACRRGFRAARGQPSNYPANETGHVSWV